MLFLLGANGLLPDWLTKSFPVIRIICIVLLLTFSVLIVITILLQKSESGGMGAISGQSSDTFYTKHKGRSIQGLLKRLTIIFAISILVITIIYSIITLNYSVV